jgi:hypothetical protein
LFGTAAEQAGAGVSNASLPPLPILLIVALLYLNLSAPIQI